MVGFGFGFYRGSYEIEATGRELSKKALKKRRKQTKSVKEKARRARVSLMWAVMMFLYLRGEIGLELE